MLIEGLPVAILRLDSSTRTVRHEAARGDKHELSLDMALVGCARAEQLRCVRGRRAEGFRGAHPRGHRQGRRGGDQRERQGHERLALLRPRLRRDALQQAHSGDRRECRQARAGVDLQPRIDARRRIHAPGGRRHHVRDGLVERGARGRCAHRQAAVELRPEGRPPDRLQGLLRRGQPRCGALQGQGLCGRLRRPPDRARCRDRRESLGGRHADRPQALVHDHRCAARRKGQCADRPGRRRVWRARLHHCLRRGERQAEVALLHRAGRPEPAVRERRDEDGRQDLGPEQQVLGSRRRRHAVGHDGVRCIAEPALHRHRQRLAVGARQAAKPEAAATISILVVDPGAERPDTGQLRLVLPGPHPATTGTTPPPSR